MKVIQIPLLRDNYGYLLVCERTGEAALIDPSEGEPVLSRVEKERVNLRAILNTHHHRDHTGGNAYLVGRLPLEVCGHTVDTERIPGLTHPLEDGDEIKVGELRGKVLFIPGHTRGHVAYLFENNLFCGDTLFVAGCGRLFEGTAEQMLASLSRLKALPANTLVHCGHEYTEKNLRFALTVEPNNKAIAEKLRTVTALRAKGASTVPSRMEEEWDTNPFLRWDSEEIRAQIGRNLAGMAPAPVSVFAEVRRLKDQF